MTNLNNETKLFLDKLKKIVIESLQKNPEGLTNQEIIEKTGIYLPVEEHKGWISWTILNNLLIEDKIKKVGRKYMLK
jgi:hypothetical protein